MDSSAVSQSLERDYAPCTSFSEYHDLNCGHRIHAPHEKECGFNCKIPGRMECFGPFLCPTCLTEQARIEVELADMVVTEDTDLVMDDAGMVPREEKIRAIVEEEVAKLEKKNYRIACLTVEKLDPVLQFYQEFPEAKIGTESKTSLEKSPPRQYKRPGRGARTLPRKRIGRDERIPVGETRAWPERHRTRPELADNIFFAEADTSRPVKPSIRERSRSPRRDNERINYRQRDEPRGYEDDTEGDAKGGLDDLVGHLQDTRVGLEKEDEVVRAVREVLEKLALDKEKAQCEKDVKDSAKGKNEPK